MIYTHTFEIKIGATTIEGEITFDHGESVSVKTNDGLELDIKQRGALQHLFEAVQLFCKCCADEIDKIEVIRKA